MSNKGPCGQQGTAERYLLGELSDAERGAFEAHYFECSVCGEEVKTMAAFVEGARSALASPERGRAPPMPSPLARRRWMAVAPALAAAAAVLLLAGYQSFVKIPALRQELALRDRPRAIVATVLRPASRGAAPAVRAAPDQPFIAVALEAPEGPTGELTVELDNEAGTAVLPPWRVDAPGVGEPLQLLIPTKNLVPGSYRLVVKVVRAGSVAGNNPVLDSYSFVFARTRS